MLTLSISELQKEPEPPGPGASYANIEHKQDHPQYGRLSRYLQGDRARGGRLGKYIDFGLVNYSFETVSCRVGLIPGIQQGASPAALAVYTTDSPTGWIMAVLICDVPRHFQNFMRNWKGSLEPFAAVAVGARETKISAKTEPGPFAECFGCIVVLTCQKSLTICVSNIFYTQDDFMSTHMKFVIGLSLLIFIPILWHFATVFGYLGAPLQTRAEFFLRIGLITAGFITLSVISATIISARLGNSELEPDEREWLIETRAERNGGWVLMAGLVGLMWFAFTPMQPMDVANAALAIIAVGEAVKIASGLLYLRGQA